MDENTCGPFSKIPPRRTSYDDAPRLVSIQGKLAEIMMVDFDENGKQDGVLVSEMSDPFGGSPDDIGQNFTESFQFYSTVQASNKNPLQCRSGGASVRADLNVTCPKGSVDEDYNRLKRRSRYAENVKLSPSINDFQCQHCRKSYFSLRSLMIHMETHRNKKKYQCPKTSHQGCQSTVSFNHIKTHQERIDFSFDEPNFEIPNAKKTTGHYDKFHQLGNSGGLPAHVGIVGPTILVKPGPIAPQKKLPIFKGRIVSIPTAEKPKSSIVLQKLAAHIASRNGVKGNNSNTKCAEVVNGAEEIDMISHKRQHQNLLSGGTLQSNNQQRYVTPEIPTTIPTLNFQCHYCDKIFSSRRDLEMHLRIHTAEKPHRCNIYNNYRSNHENNMRRHLEVHRGKKLIACATCSECSIACLNSHNKKALKDDSKGSTELAAQEINHQIDLECKGKPQKITFFQSTSPKSYLEFTEEVARKNENIRGFLEQQVQNKSERILGDSKTEEDSELAKLENKEIETYKLEVMTRDTHSKQNSETKSPLPYKCEFCRFTCKFRIGLNKHVAKSHADISTRVETCPDMVPADEVVVNEQVMTVEQISDRKYEKKLYKILEQDSMDENEPAVINSWTITDHPWQETPVSQKEASAYGYPGAPGSTKYTHEIQFSSQSKSPQPPFQNSTNSHPDSLPIPASTYSSNAISSMAPPTSVLTLQLIVNTDFSSTTNIPKSVPPVPQLHINNNSTCPGQFNSTVTTSAPTTLRYVPHTSASLHQQITSHLLDNSTVSNGNISPMNFQPEFQPKSSHFNLKQRGSPVGNTVPIKSKSWTIPACVCAYSSIGFRQRNKLIRHTRIHNGEEPYECDYTTSHAQSLVIHNRRHSGERPYTCDICGLTTASLQALFIHRKRHEKPFKCRFCPRVSCDRAVIKRHEKLHFNIVQQNS